MYNLIVIVVHEGGRVGRSEVGGAREWVGDGVRAFLWWSHNSGAPELVAPC